MDRKKRAKYLTKFTGASIGKGGEIATSVNFGSEPYLLSFGDNVRIASGVNFYTHEGAIGVIRILKPEYKNAGIYGRIVVGNNVHIGSHSTIMPGVTIGNNVIIGSGAIVTHDIPDNSVAVGVPARVICTVDDFFEKNADKIVFTYQMSEDERRDFLLEKFSNK